MNQTTKRLYGTLATVAFVSGLTGAFAFNALNHFTGEKKNFMTDTELVETPDHVNNDIMEVSTAKATPSQPVDLTEAAEKGCAAVVYIKVTMGGKTQTIEYRDPFEDFFGDFFGRGNGGGTQRRQVQTPKREAAGSGVLISKDGYIVTNNHVVESADDIRITLNDNREFSATVIGTDADTDLALLKIDGDNLPTLTIGDSDALKVGEWVLAVGNPVGLNTTVTAGIVSAKARNLGASSREDIKTRIQSFIQTDAAINQGNSGGALVNVRGELVGINAMLYSQTGSYIGYGFAIPTSIVKKVVSDLKEYGTVQRAMLGISGMDLINYIDSKKADDDKFKADFGTIDGVYVAEVMEEGAAHDAGLRSGDIIVSIDGKKITKMSELQEATTKYAPGDKAVVGIYREKKEKAVTITFKNAKGTTAVVKTTNIAVLGAEFKELTDNQKKTLNLSSGVQITSLKSGRLADAGIEKDFIIRKVNGQTVKTVKELEQVFKIAQNSEDQTLWIWGQTPAGRQMSFAVFIGEEN